MELIESIKSIELIESVEFIQSIEPIESIVLVRADFKKMRLSIFWSAILMHFLYVRVMF